MAKNHATKAYSGHGGNTSGVLVLSVTWTAVISFLLVLVAPVPLLYLTSEHNKKKLKYNNSFINTLSLYEYQLIYEYLPKNSKDVYH